MNIKHPQTIYNALMNVITGCLTAANNAHPGIINISLKSSLAKRVAGQLLTDFEIKPKRKKTTQTI